MEDKFKQNRTGKIAYVYDNEDPHKAKFVGHFAVNSDGKSVGKIHMEHSGEQSPEKNLCAMSEKGRYNYPSFSRLNEPIEVFDTSGNSIGWRFTYRR